MTEDEWKAKERSLKAQATRYRNKAKLPGLSFAQKVQYYAMAKKADDALRYHRLNCFNLITEEKKS